MSYESENQELGMQFLDNYFNNWEGGDKGNWGTIEFESTFSCALNCEYCYLNNYQEDLEQMDYNMGKIVKNGKMLMDWLVENSYTPKIDFFGGSPFIFEENFELLDYMIEGASQLNKPGPIVVPSSYIWLGDSEKKRKVERLLEKSRKLNVPLSLSASVDGKYCDDNRPTPLINRDEDYYDKVFAFNGKYDLGYHPMIYSKHIDNWEDNWLWYMDKLQEFNQSPQHMYLLEVRNPEWGEEQIETFGDFIKFLLDWTYWYNDHDGHDLMDFVLNDGFNILRPFSGVGRGMGCSIQSTVMVQLANLSIKPCHRLTYEEMQLANFEHDEGKITGININNPALLIGHTTVDQETFPMCQDCPIKHLCSGGCYGANYEETGSMFAPVPTVCQLEHEKMYSMYEWYEKNNLLPILYNRIDDKFVNNFKLLSKLGV